MRFSSVLTYDLTNGLSFNFNNLFSMKNIESTDIEHLGKTTKLCIIKIINNIDIPMINWNSIKNEINMKYNISDFTMGLCIFVPITSIIAYTFYKIPYKTYLVIIFGTLYFLSKNNKIN